MSSKGTQRYVFRIPQSLTEEIRLTITRRNTWSADAEWTLSDFVRVACLEKLRKMDRSRRPRRIAVAVPEILPEFSPPLEDSSSIP